MTSQTNTTILYDRFSFMAYANGPSSERSPEYNDLLDNSGKGMVVSGVMETTHYALAFPEGSDVLPHITPHLSALISNGALVFRYHTLPAAPCPPDERTRSA